MNFQDQFEALTGYSPYDWQIRLFEQFAKGEIPQVCSIPTGLGKTSVIPIWLIALAFSSQEGRADRLPRRLVYIVNRRTVVDQATDLVEQMNYRLKSKEELGVLREALQGLAASDGSPLAVSTLRGELADNQEWKADPARPAVIIGTIDMTGSKLLFSWYGDGRVGRAHHAGLIGQDALIVHDEAHLTPPFSGLLQAVRDEQTKSGDMRPIRVMELSATPASANGKDTFSLLDGEAQPEIRQRLEAQKTLRLHPAGNAKLEEQIAELALKWKDSIAKVLIYVRTPENAGKIAEILSKKSNPVSLLTGTIRGHERDQLVKKDDVYRMFLTPEAKPEQTVYLVSTSAGEVGVDWDADHLVCDLMPLDSMIQRLGRVNRRGGKESFLDCVVDLGKEKKGAVKDFEAARQETIKILERLPKRGADGYDASPKALTQLLESLGENERRQAFTPQPDKAAVTDILFDAWSLTSITQSLPGRPEVAEFLHGLTTADPPETYVAWRDEVRLLCSEAIHEEALSEWFERCRLETRERLRDHTKQVFNQLEALSNRHINGSLPIILLNSRGEFERKLTLQKLIEEGKNDREKRFLFYRTVILPAEAGGLSEHGMLDAKAKITEIDVAEAGGDRTRVILERRDNEYRYRFLLSWKAQEISEETEVQEGETGTREWFVCDSYREAAAKATRDLNQNVSYILPLREPAEEEEEETIANYLVLLETQNRAVIDQSERIAMRRPPTVEEHTRHVTEHIEKIARALGLPEELQTALRLAANYHDQGKSRPVWQRAIQNINGEPLAKSGRKGMNSRRLGGFRHEFASLLEAMQDSGISGNTHRDLILHLIAAHHGRARPHFDPDAFDPTQLPTQAQEEAACEVMRRFSRLQLQFGRWGLAWLEALLRCADIAASQAESEGRYPVKDGTR